MDQCSTNLAAASRNVPPPEVDGYPEEKHMKEVRHMKTVDFVLINLRFPAVTAIPRCC